MAALIGERIREVRERTGWSQDELAEHARVLGGLSWTRSMLAKIERGDRGVTLEEVLVLPWVLHVRPRELFTGDGSVALSPAGEMSLETIRHMWSEDFDTAIAPAPGVVRLRSRRRDLTARFPWTGGRERAGRRFPWASADDHAKAEQEMQADTVQKAARALAKSGCDVSPRELALAARQLWGEGLVEHRETVLRARTDVPPAKIAGARRHITRSMLGELRTLLASLPE